MPGQTPVTAAWLNRLTEACRPFYVLAFADDQHDYMTNVLLTLLALLDFQTHNKMVEFADFLAAWAMAGDRVTRPVDHHGEAADSNCYG